MKKLALFLALCLLLQAIGLTAFADEAPVEVPELTEQAAEAPAEEPAAEEEEPIEEPKAEEPVEEPKAEEPVEEPKAEEPVEEPKAEEPVEEPKAEEPVEEPKTEEPVEEPKTEEPVEEPKTEEPVEEPKTEEPVEEPKTEEPVEEPKTEEPVEEPKTEEPVEEPVEEPKTEEPVEEPKTEEPVEEPVEEPKAEEPVEEPKAEEPVEEPAVEEPAEEEPAEEEIVHFAEGYILIKANTKVYAFANAKKVLGTVMEDSYAWAVIEKTAADPANDWLKIVFDTKDGEEITAFIRMKSIQELTDKEQASLVKKLNKQKARKLGENPVPTAAYKPWGSAKAETKPEETVATNAVVKNGDQDNFVLDDNNWICEYNGDMTAIVLPSKVGGKTVKGITQAAFSGNTSIVSIVIPASGYNYIENGAFKGCTALESVSMYNPVTSIVGEAFMGCTSLRAISWPQNLTKIEHDAFNGCVNLRAIGLTTNLVTIEDNAFRNCTGLSDLDFEDSTSLTTIGSGAFYGCTSLRAIVLPSSVTKLGNSAFESCSSATKVTLPANLTRIENFTFRNCYSLKSVAIPSKVTYIGREAFANCSSLSYVTIPKGILNILKDAFAGITSNTVLFMQNCNPTLGTNALGTSGIVVGNINSKVHKYVKAHSGQRFVSTDCYNYIVRCYSHLVSRNPTMAERLKHIRNLAAGKATGASIVSEVMESSECGAKKWNNTQKVQKLYRIMLNRTSNPSASEIAGWKSYLDVGMSSMPVIKGIANSPEYKDKCAKWLLKPGTVTITNYRDRNKAVTTFVRNAYAWAYYKGTSSKVTVANLEAGCKNLLVSKWTAYRFLHSLVTSSNFKSAVGSNNTTYVTYLYHIYLSRTPSTSEVNGWVKQITVNKKSWAWVETGFSNATEFANKMKKLNLKVK